MMSVLSFDREKRTRAPVKRSDFRPYYEKVAARTLKSVVLHFRLIAVLVVVGLVLASLIIPLLPRKYSAEALIYPKLYSDEQVRSVPLASVEASSLIATEARLLHSDELLRGVVQRVGLDKEVEAARSYLGVDIVDWLRSTFVPEMSNESSSDRAVAMLRNKVRVVRDTRSYFVSVSYTARSPEEAAAIVNAFALEFLRLKSLQTKQAAVSAAATEVERLRAIYGEKHPKLVQAQEAHDGALAVLQATASPHGGDGVIVDDSVKLALPNRTPTSPKGLEILGISATAALLVGIGLAVWVDRKQVARKNTRGRSPRPSVRAAKTTKSSAPAYAPLGAVMAAVASVLARIHETYTRITARLVDSLTGARTLVARASWTLADQGIVSAGNFLATVLLARELGQQEYGEFALFLGAIFVLRGVDYSFISYPLSVRLWHSNGETYSRPHLMGISIVLAAALSLVLVSIIGLGITLAGLTEILMPVCLCYLCWQALETTRRGLIAEFRYREAVTGDAVAYLGQSLAIGVLVWGDDTITLAEALYAMATTFAAGAVVHASRLHVAWSAPADMWREMRRWAADYCSIGKWSFVNYQLVLARVQIFPWLLAATLGTAATASFQAGLNIANVMNPIIFGIGNAIPQVAAHGHSSTGGVARGLRAALGYILFGLGPILIICLAVLLLPDVLLNWVYGPSSPYHAIMAGVQLLAIAYVFEYIADTLGNALLGVQKGKVAFLVNAMGFAVALVLALTLVGPLGVYGACLALLIANATRMVAASAAAAWLILRDRHRGNTRLALKAIGSTMSTEEAVR